MPIQNVSLNTPYSAQEQEIERQRRMAEAMQAQSMQPIQGGMQGQVYVPPSWTQGAAQLAKALVGGMGMSKAGEQSQDLARRRSEAMAAALKGMPVPQTQSTTGEGMTGGLDMQDYPQGAAPGDTRTTQPTMQQNAEWLGQLGQIGPDALNIGNAMMGRQDRQTEIADQRAFRGQELQLAREARAAELQMRLQDSRTTAADRAALQRELAQMQIDARRDMTNQSNALRRDIAGQASADRAAAIAQGGKPPPGFRFKPNGDMERIPGGPADIKAEADLQKRSAGAGDVDVALGTLRDAYDRLDTGGGIVSTDKSAIENVGPALASTGVGQAAGKMFGTKNQSARNDIAMARPALLAALMKATGMSAKQMDSNAELKLWLSTATDPALDVQSNRRALDNIEKKYISPAAPQRRATDSPGATGEWAIVK